MLRIFRLIAFLTFPLQKGLSNSFGLNYKAFRGGGGYQKEPSNFWLRVANNLAVNFDNQKEQLNQHFKKIGHKWRSPVLTQ